MATLSELVKSGDLISISARLNSREFEERRLYGSKSMVTWCKGPLKELVKERYEGRATPLEQLDDLFRQYVIGADWSEDDRRFKHLKNFPEPFVWELKTIDLRLFGWVPVKDHFVVVSIGDADEIKDSKELYQTHIDEVVDFRDSLDLDHPKYVESTEVSDVISA